MFLEMGNGSCYGSQSVRLNSLIDWIEFIGSSSVGNRDHGRFFMLFCKKTDYEGCD